MSDTKWTPGPWVNHGRIESAPGPKYSAIAANTLLARVYSEAFGDEQNEIANANLIAAAPDLYEALHYAVTHIELELGYEHDAAVNGRKLLAKARGVNV